jgi:DNA polymerase-3 subunit alpha
MPATAMWTIAERMTQEKDSFGFYFSAHPIERFRHLTEAHGARSFSSLAEMTVPADGSRVGATMAVLVEEARWRTSARGRRYLFATLSDPSGQFVATVFDDRVASQIEDAARAGACALLSVELDRREGDETPRVTVRALQSFESLSSRTRLELAVEVEDSAALARIAAAVASDRRGNGQIRLSVRIEGGQEELGSGYAELVLGRDFILDAETASRIERIEGVASVRLAVAQAPKLALVS